MQITSVLQSPHLQHPNLLPNPFLPRTLMNSWFFLQGGYTYDCPKTTLQVKGPCLGRTPGICTCWGKPDENLGPDLTWSDLTQRIKPRMICKIMSQYSYANTGISFIGPPDPGARGSQPKCTFLGRNLTAKFQPRQPRNHAKPWGGPPCTCRWSVGPDLT